jgi:glycosyltransferase involved in cell wall biosynthesis
MSLPAISVLMPVYNAEKYIESAVDSILNQTFTDFEFIIINDGSTDSTFKILEKYAMNDERIRLISRENKGLVETLNEGINLARAPLLARMDADDVSLPNRLELQKSFLDEHPDVMCLGGKVELIDAKGRCIGFSLQGVTHEELELIALQGVTPFCHPSVLMNKQAVMNAGGYKSEHYPAEDFGLFLSLCLSAKVASLEEIVLLYRVHDEAISTQLNSEQIKVIKSICTDAWATKGKRYTLKTAEYRLSTSHDVFDTYLRNGWFAFNSKRRLMALEYAIKAIAMFPISTEGWRLFVCALFKKTTNKFSYTIK